MEHVGPEHADRANNDAVAEARNEIERAISNWLRVVAEESDDPDRVGGVLLGWVVALEWTTIEMEQNNQAGRDIVAQMQQMLSTTRGLGEYISDNY